MNQYGYRAVQVISSGDIIGNFVVNSRNCVLAFSQNPEPDDEILDILIENKIYSEMTETTEIESRVTDSDTYLVLGGLNPQLQGGYNCIVAAASNLVWHYGNNGKPSLLGDGTWSDVISTMDDSYSVSGGYANNSTQSAMITYGYLVGTSLSSAVWVNWNPVRSVIYKELTYNRPFMLGFAAAESGSFSPVVRHMTMCCGYSFMNNNWYSYVVTGHQVGPTFMIWNSEINDCAIKVHWN